MKEYGRQCLVTKSLQNEDSILPLQSRACFCCRRFFFVTLAIKLESRGSAFCLQPRYGLNGATIKVFRFRSTMSDRTFNQLPIESPCTTRVGHALDRTGIDKVPQLINVLRGEMSIVGPCLYTTAPGKALRTGRQGNAKPGMVNWALVSSYWENTGRPAAVSSTKSNAISITLKIAHFCST
jgi:lipopolysaccharide/colanic/teichoic acid biosynthesis glycosyltransferase